MLYMDALVNCYTAVLLSLSMFTVLFKSETAQDGIMDSLGLAFVLNIDDLSSDLGFLGDVWDATKVGKFYAGLNLCMSADVEGAEEAGELIAIAEQLNRIPHMMYSLAQFSLMLLLPVAFVTPFFLQSSAEVDENLMKILHINMTQSFLE